MKRSGPLRRSGPPVRRTRVRAVSPRRRRELRRRAEVRALVHDRDRTCRGPVRGLPGRCRVVSADRPPLEVHEVVGRGRDSTAWLDPERCVLLCQAHHDMCTSASGRVLEIVRRAGLDVPADPVDTLRIGDRS